MVDIVNGVLVRNGHVLMALRAKSRSTYPAKWSFPGGHVEEGETLSAALSRELVEEIGVRPLSERCIAKLSAEADSRNADVVFHIFAIEAWTGEPANLGNEHDQLAWFSLDEAKAIINLALEAYREVFDELRCGCA